MKLPSNDSILDESVPTIYTAYRLYNTLSTDYTVAIFIGQVNGKICVGIRIDSSVLFDRPLVVSILFT